jgi:hypothetical protein
MITPKDKEYWYNSDKWVIIGFSRCGTTSASRYFHCSHPEIGYSGVTPYYLEHYSNHIPIFITRNPVDRIWSMYNYHGVFKNMTFEEMLDFKDDKYQNVGCNDCIKQSDYMKYIEPFRQFNPIIYKLEDLKRRPDYPKDWRGQSSKKIPKEFREKIEKRLSNAGIEY